MSNDEASMLNPPPAIIRDAVSTTWPPTAVASATLRSAAHTINPGWTAADCIAHLIMLATEIERVR